jgi:hypothetical protein
LQRIADYQLYQRQIGQRILRWQIKTGVFQMTYRIVPIAAIAALFLAGCGETPKETASDVAEANKAADNSKAEVRTKANDTVTKSNEGAANSIQTYAQSDAEAQPKLGTAEADAMSKGAQAAYELAIKTAEEGYKLATQKCNALGGASRIACENSAEAILATANADAAAKRDAALSAAK